MGRPKKNSTSPTYVHVRRRGGRISAVTGQEVGRSLRENDPHLVYDLSVFLTHLWSHLLMSSLIKYNMFTL